jgi:hypothetical protein
VNFFSPNSDTVELRFSPTDNDGGYNPGAGSIISRLRQLAQEADESIFYMLDAWSTFNGGTHLKDDINANAVAFKAGCAGDTNKTDWDTTIFNDLRANHTLRNQPGNFNLLHSKTFIFDMEVVATGSPNFTAAATRDANGNNEAHVIVHDFRLARRYMQHYHHIMRNADPDPGTDLYDSTPPAAPSALAATASAGSFSLTWTPSASTDVVRYYIFIDTAPLTANRIGDGVDDNASGNADDDPEGMVSFPAGATVATIKAGDDNADGTVGNDPWIFPEVMVKGRAVSAATVSTRNVGDSLAAGVNYYFAIVAVDTQGNESAPDTFGPIQLGMETATVTCTVLLEARGNHAGCTAMLYNGVETYTAASNAAGTIVFIGVESGVYTFTGKETSHLRRTVTGIAVAGVDTSVNIGTLYAGDANDDNRIDIFDAAIVKYYMTAGSGPRGDIDGDLDVDAADLVWIRRNFGRRGE